MRTLEQINARLDRLYARAYDLECIECLDLEQRDYDQWKRTYQSVTDEILALEAEQDEWFPRSAEVLHRDAVAFVQRQAGY